jgi:hypothetical protein
MAHNKKTQELFQKLENLEGLLQKLEKYDIFLYDNGTALYFMHTPTERKTRFFWNDSKNLAETLTEFCEKLLAKLEA